MDFTSNDKQLKRAAEIDYQMIKAIRNKRRRIYSSSDDDNDDDDKVNKTTKYQKTQSGISIQNPRIPTSVFYSKESTNKIKINTSPVKPLVNDNIKENISSKIEALMTKKSPKKNHKKINRRLNTNEPKLGNKGVKHCIRRPKKIKIIGGKLVKLSKKSKINRNKLIAKKLNNNNNNEPTIKYNNENQKPTNKTKSFVNIDTYYTDTDSDSEDDEFDATDDELLQNDHTSEKEIEQDSSTLGKKKFFKSTVKPIRNEFQVMKNLKMTVYKGKLLVLKDKRLKQKRKHPSKNRISKIIQDLSRSPEKPSLPSKDIVEEPATHSPKISIENINQNSYDSDHIAVLTDDSIYTEFHNRLPYNTNDPKIIEQQHLLLEFLITHNICNEENFKIFIADPDNHKEKAAEIVNSLAVVVLYSDENLPIEGTEINESIILPEDYESELINSSNNTSEILCHGSKSQSPSPTNEDKNDQIEDDEVSKANDDNLKSSEENVESQIGREETSTSDENTQKKLFSVFYPDNFKNKHIETESIKHRRNSLKGTGLNQYQIDAGQKEFGAKQCAQCGLLYTVHEPEEEKLHNEYHQSLEVFQFKGWNDEIIAQKCPEWSTDGRIIIITNLSNTKRKKRLMDILQIVDNQLGFASYIFPSQFTAYLAIKSNKIVGICLTQPLQKANKYIRQNGIDCCSEEFYDVKCGISRIWISPLHRRIGIASKLISTVQLYTIPGEMISLDEIAFSAPTEDGKAFARKITKKDDFLVYQ